jgi:hypothetical protein
MGLPMIRLFCKCINKYLNDVIKRMVGYVHNML